MRGVAGAAMALGAGGAAKTAVAAATTTAATARVAMARAAMEMAVAAAERPGAEHAPNLFSRSKTRSCDRPFPNKGMVGQFPAFSTACGGAHIGFEPGRCRCHVVGMRTRDRFSVKLKCPSCGKRG